MPSGLDGNPTPIVTPQRSKVLDELASLVVSRKSPTAPLLLAVDGIDGAGKTTFADELAATLQHQGARTVRATIDSFHRPQAQRWARGRSSPVGFFLDSHDLDGIRLRLLDPFASGSGMYVTAAFDVVDDREVVQVPQAVSTEDILVFDGIFSLRSELAEYWDLTVFLDGQQRVDLQRLSYVLDELPDDPIDVVAHVLDWSVRIDRYSAGMRYYMDLADPMQAADVVIENNDICRPRIIRTAATEPNA